MIGTINLGGGNVFYEVAGEGEPLVFLHAGFVDSAMWDDQWQPFSQHYTVIRYDMLGFGRSDRMGKAISRRHELYGVLEATGVKRAILVGCSIGGETALDATLDRPELVSSLVIVSTIPGGFMMQGEMPKGLMDMMAAVEHGDFERASELQMRLWMDGPYRQAGQTDPIVRRRAAQMSRGALEKGDWRLLDAPPPDPLDPPAIERLQQMHVPTLIIAGELDNAEFARAAGVMESAIPGAKKVILPGCAHLPNMEKPNEFNQVVLDFLGTIN